MPTTSDEVLSDEDVGIQWKAPTSNDVFSDADVGISWKAAEPKKKSMFSRPTPEEGLAIRKLVDENVANPEFRRDPTFAAPEDYERLSTAPLIPPNVVRGAIELGGGALTETLPKGAREFAGGLKEGTAELAAGLSSPQALATLPAFLIPVAKEALSLIMGGSAIGEHSYEFLDAIEKKDWNRAGKAAVNVVGGAAMAVPAVHGPISAVRGPAIPESPPVILPDPDMVARNLAAPGTVRPQEIQRIGPPPEPEAPPMFQAGEVPFQNLRRFGSQPLPPVDILPQMGRLAEPTILEETRPKQELETRGKVSFGAEAPTLLRNALEESPQVPAEVTRTIVQAAPILPKAAEAAAAAVTEKPYVPSANREPSRFRPACCRSDS